ncbi:solute carrier organic anion transporter family member 2A1-like [Liolophura sinensis]|uniref:solute carrier organic anion transporter family member 2A1-like n=1 Tax=Liolophura sinensis TaxID=3198878 RepID=UPI0031594C0C
MEEPICDEVSGASGNYIALGIFLTAMLIQGAVTAPRAPLSGTFIDDNNPVPMNSGKYIGILMGVLTFSTVVSFGSGAISSCIFHTLEETSLTPGDPQWIGAWWLGFLVLGTLSIVFSFLILFFPKRLKVASLKSTPAREVKVSNEIGGHTSFNQILSGFVEPLKCVFRILRIPVFTLVVLTITMHTFAILGMVSFFPKYLETQFYRPAYQASIMVGEYQGACQALGLSTVVGVISLSYWNCSCTLGTAASGLCQQEDPTVYPLLVYATAVSFLSMFSTSASFMIIVRSVREEEKSLALGLSSFISTLLGKRMIYGFWTGCLSHGLCSSYVAITMLFRE